MLLARAKKDKSSSADGNKQPSQHQTATLLLDRLRDFVVAPSSVGGNFSSQHDSQSVDELATLDRYHHFHGHSGLCA